MISAPKNNFENLSSDLVPRISPHMEVEYFDNNVLIFDLHRRTVMELDGGSVWVLKHVNGQDSLAQIAVAYAAAFLIGYEQALDAMRETCAGLLRADCVRPAYGSWKGNGMDATRYIVNPDVNLREEDEDGALLYNPDADRVQLLNISGLYIWKLCAQGRTMGEIVSAMQADFEGVSVEDVATDVEEFLNQMTESGFIGTLQSS